MQHFPSKDMQSNIDNAAVPGLWRRLAAMFYDSWLVAALWLLGVTVDTFVGAGSEGSHLVLQIYATLSPMVFFSWFWMHGGQTLGMRAWRLKLLSGAGTEVTLRQSLTRCFAALLSMLALGLGYLWILFDRDGLAWHDRISNTRLVIMSKN
jgi:uncharacterized RDD family membrane protein YckC